MDPSELINFGLGGVIIGLFVTGWIVPKPQHDRVTAERNKAWDQRDAVVDDVHNKVAPALEKATAAILSREEQENLVIEAMVEARDVLIDVRRLLERRLP